MPTETRIKNFHTAATLAEHALAPFHVKITVAPDSVPTGDWSAADGQVTNHETRRFTLNVTNSDFGTCQVMMSDGQSNDLVVMAQSIAERVLKELKGKDYTHQDEAMIYGSTENLRSVLRGM